MKTSFLSAFVVALLALDAGHAGVIDPKFSIDPSSPAIDGNVSPDDVLRSGPAVFTQGTTLGLAEDFFGDDLDALDLDKGPGPFTYFSVDDSSVNGVLSSAILFTDFTGGFSLWASAADIGLRDDD